MGRGFHRDEFKTWDPYPGRPEGSQAVIKPSAGSSINNGYICTIFDRNDPVGPHLIKSLPKGSSIPWNDSGSKVVQEVQFKGRLSKGAKARVPEKIYKSYCRVGFSRLAYSDRIDVYQCSRRINYAENKERKAKLAASVPDSTYPNTVGLRNWVVCDCCGKLKSPSFPTHWHSSELKSDADMTEILTTTKGIYAHLVTKGLWSHTEYGLNVCGIVERFGAYQLGNRGWKSESVKILRLITKTEELRDSLSRLYPNVTVVCDPVGNSKDHYPWISAQS